jgi:hypothetical protein
LVFKQLFTFFKMSCPIDLIAYAHNNNKIK